MNSFMIIHQYKYLTLISLDYGLTFFIKIMKVIVNSDMTIY